MSETLGLQAESTHVYLVSAFGTFETVALS